jgi:glycosyltransferase involved in cell wall biosynthesis
VVGDAAWEQQKKYLRKIQTLVAKGADSIIVPSHYVKKMVQRWGVLGEKIKVIYNAPEPAPQLRVSKTEAKERIGLSGDIILSIGRLVPWKGFSDLIAIMPDLLKVNPKFQLVIVGQGKERLPSGPGVKLVGSVPHSLVPLYFKAADIFVLNSGYEGLSHAILEAMQFGVPVIASREGGNPELIEDNFNGLLVEYKNRKEIKEAILKLWQNRDLQEKFIRNSKEKLKDFSWENLVKKTLEVLRK